MKYKYFSALLFSFPFPPSEAPKSTFKDLAVHGRICIKIRITKPVVPLLPPSPPPPIQVLVEGMEWTKHFCNTDGSPVSLHLHGLDVPSPSWLAVAARCVFMRSLMAVHTAARLWCVISTWQYPKSVNEITVSYWFYVWLIMNFGILRD